MTLRLSTLYYQYLITLNDKLNVKTLSNRRSGGRCIISEIRILSILTLLCGCTYFVELVPTTPFIRAPVIRIGNHSDRSKKQIFCLKFSD